jgi:hypothetical protein
MNKNFGGKIQLQKGSSVRFLENDGCVSDDVYTISSSVTDYKARALLKNDNRNILIHYDRLLPLDSINKAVCVLGNKSTFVTCPDCKIPREIDKSVTSLSCCDKEHEIHFMTEASEEMGKENSNFDLNSIPESCEIWIKDGSFIDGINLRTVQLVINDCNPRKFIFNLYNGKTSSTGKSIDSKLREFISGVAENQKAFWYKIDPDKYEKSIVSKGYSRYSREQVKD